MKKLFCFLSLLIINSGQLFAAEEFTITTYYPSPYGSYNELSTNKMAIGDRTADGLITGADQPPNNGQLIIGNSTGATQLILTDASQAADLKHKIISSSLGTLNFGKVNDAFDAYTSQVTIANSGNVGIGTVNPNYELHLHSSSGGAAFQLTNGGLLGGGQTATDGFIISTDAVGNAYISNREDSEIRFLTDNTSRMRISSGGNISIGPGTVSPAFKLYVLTDSAGKPNGGSWSNLSDRRIKKNVSSISGALDRIARIRGVNFEWINPEEHQASGVRQGFIAQEVEKVFPNFITEIDASGKDRELVKEAKIKSLSLPFDFDANLVEAIKELKLKNEALEDRIVRLEKKLKAINKK